MIHLTKTLSSIALALALAIGLVACGSKASDGQPATPPTESSAAVKAESPDAETPDAEVAFEPAYPEEVSEEGLTDSDKEQQEETHTHEDGEAHSHGEGGDHSHG